MTPARTSRTGLVPFFPRDDVHDEEGPGSACGRQHREPRHKPREGRQRQQDDESGSIADSQDIGAREFVSGHDLEDRARNREVRTDENPHEDPRETDVPDDELTGREPIGDVPAEEKRSPDAEVEDDLWVEHGSPRLA